MSINRLLVYLMLSVTVVCVNACEANQDAVAINSPDAPANIVTEKNQTDVSVLKQPAKAHKTNLAGIDVSHFQGVINWQAVAADGIDFAFIKATQGRATIDAQFAYNKEQLQQLDLPWGVYHYLDPSIDATLQAKHFIATVGDEFGHFPPVVDIEAFENRDAKTVIKVLHTFLSEVEKHYRCPLMIYTSPGFWDALDDHAYGDHKLWLADYASRPTLPNGWRRWTFWQYTDKGTVAGVNGKVDRNRFLGSELQLKRLTCP